MATRPPRSRRRFNGDWDELQYLYGKALHWFFRESTARTLRNARRFAARIPLLLGRIPRVMRSIPGQEAAALNAEIRGDWVSASKHRRKVVNLIEVLRELAVAEVPIARRAILRDYAPAKLADAYDLLAISQMHQGRYRAARMTLQQSRDVCATHRIRFEGEELLLDVERELAEMRRRTRTGRRRG